MTLLIHAARESVGRGLLVLPVLDCLPVQPGRHRCVGDDAPDGRREHDHTDREAEQPPAPVDCIADELDDHAGGEQGETDGEPRRLLMCLAPRREAHQESARFTVGFALLAAGVIVQLVGYAVDGGWWLLGLAIGVIVLAAAVGRVIADAPVTSWLHRQAVEYWENEQASPD